MDAVGMVGGWMGGGRIIMGFMGYIRRYSYGTYEGMGMVGQASRDDQMIS